MQKDTSQKCFAPMLCILTFLTGCEQRFDLHLPEGVGNVILSWLG